MSSTANYAATPRVSSATLTTADVSVTAPTIASTVFTAGASGSRIDYIELIGLATTTASQVNLFIYDGSNYILWQQVPVAAITATATTPTFTFNFSSVSNSNIMPLTLPTTYSLRATIATNQVVANSSDVAVSTSASVASGAYAVLTTAASTTAIAAAATVSSAYYTLTSSPYTMTNPSQVTFTSATNQSGNSFVIRGLDATGTAISETLVGPNNTTVYSVNVYTVILSVYSTASMSGTMSIGYSSTYTNSTAPVKITQTSGSTSNTGVNWTITGVNPAGALTTETLTGAGAGLTVTSVNTYKTVTSIKASAAATAASFGYPIILGGVRVIAYGGDF